MTDFYHICFAVPDLEAAMEDLTAAAGMSWNKPRADTLNGWPYRIVFSCSVPHIELIESTSGSPWDSTDGAHFHHVGWWARSLPDSARHMTESGFPQDFDGCPYGRNFAYHRMSSIGARIEIVDAAAQSDFLRVWNPGVDSMPTLDDRNEPDS